jgi:drug/metabolite transporter (DMT)-like permease
VTYLVPPIALAYGAVFLDERLGLSAFGALALIFAGVLLGTGRLRLRRPVASQA